MPNKPFPWHIRRDELIKALGPRIETAAPPGDGIDVRAVLTSLAKRWPDEPDADSVASLEALCRKIGVTKKMQERYGPNWQHSSDGTPLPNAWWALVLCCLLAYSSTKASTDRARFGLAAKCLNAALQAIDIVRAFGDSVEIAEWAAQANALCDELEREVSA